MHFEPLEIPEVFLLTPEVFFDRRGCFFESWNDREFAARIGVRATFVQDNHSISTRGTLRGLHFQCVRPQGKLVRVTRGEVFDVAVDLRLDAPSFGKWLGVILSGENRRQLWIPEGFAHGFLVLTDEAELQYKVTDYWSREGERTIRFDDPDIGIEWPKLDVQPVLSDKDAAASCLMELNPEQAWTIRTRG
jgi:dTDP-4-dehydrorhamnose 3,5-epimerase